jgi:NADPH:quinone reductase-like Zn-dependent oxidoreductase
MKGLQLTGHGDPAQVVKLVDVPDVGPPGAGEVVIEVEASPIEPTDQYIIAGVYGRLPALPHLLGCQGIGRVVSVGRGVKHLREGDSTLVPLLSNAWVERVKVDASSLSPLPKGDVNQMSMLGMNPATAHLLLTEYVQPQRGDWIVQNGANSAVGRAIIPIARARGLKTVNVVRRQELVDELRKAGGDVVLMDGPDLHKRIAEATENAKISLAIDGVGGTATQRLLDSIEKYGTVAVYSGMSGEPATISGPHLVFFSQSVRALWIVNWLQIPGNLEKFGAICSELAPLVASGKISLPIVGEFALDQYQEALALASKYRGKVIFKPNGRG